MKNSLSEDAEKAEHVETEGGEKVGQRQPIATGGHLRLAVVPVEDGRVLQVALWGRNGNV